MDDLIPFLVFIVIALINLVKFIMEKGLQGKRPPQPTEEGAPEQEPATIEDFFEELAGKLAPKPTKLPDWPEGIEKPDYVGEMKAFREEPDDYPWDEEPARAEIIPMPMPMPEPVVEVSAVAAQPAVAIGGESLKRALGSVPNAFTGTKSIKLNAVPAMRLGSSRGSIAFPLTDRKELRQAIIANIIFSPPRAYDTTFENVIVK
jgi:hypothetical protein